MYVNETNKDRILVPKPKKRRSNNSEETSFAEEIESLLQADSVELTKDSPKREAREQVFGRSLSENERELEEEENPEVSEVFKLDSKELDVTA